MEQQDFERMKQQAKAKAEEASLAAAQLDDDMRQRFGKGWYFVGLFVAIVLLGLLARCTGIA